MRINAVFKPADILQVDDQALAESAAMFATMFPNIENPAFDEHHAGMAIAAVNPALALHLRSISAFMLLEMPFGQHAALRELAIATVHRKLDCQYGFKSRLDACKAAGISDAILAVLPVPDRKLLDAEQALVVEYAAAVVDNEVNDELLDRFVEYFDEKSAVECASIVGLWSCWTMIINIGQP